MKHFHHAVLQLTALFSSVNAASWMIDGSCDAASGKAAFVRTTMISALSLNSAALAALATPPMAAGVQVAADFLFNTGKADLCEEFGSNRVYGGLTGISRLTSEVTDKTLLDRDGVMIYCDQSRVEKRTQDGTSFHFDNDVQQKLEIADHISCSIAKKGMMYTTIPKDNKYMQVQICPSFLEWALAKSAGQLQTASLFSNMWKKVTIEMVQKFAMATVFTAIDAYSLVDKMLLHELTHANRQYSTEDVKINFLPAYGWRQCRSLSTVATQPLPGTLGGDGPFGPEVNADSWALFASISWMFANNRITRMNSDGTFA